MRFWKERRIVCVHKCQCLREVWKAFHLTLCALFDCTTLPKTATEGHQLQGKRCQESCRKKIHNTIPVCALKEKSKWAALSVSVPQIKVKLLNQWGNWIMLYLEHLVKLPWKPLWLELSVIPIPGLVDMKPYHAFWSESDCEESSFSDSSPNLPAKPSIELKRAKHGPGPLLNMLHSGSFSSPVDSL